MQSLAEYAAATCDALVPGHPRALTLREMASAARLTAYAARKTVLSQAIRASLRQIAAGPEPVATAGQLQGHILALKALAAEMEALRAEWETLWLARARRSEIHVALGYFATLHTRLQAASAWLKAQHQAVLAGEPVDAELASYQAGDHRVLWHNWPD